jgi:inorganic pyrophosphatase
MPDNLVAVVEIPKGSSNKYEWDEALGAIKLDRLLFSSRLPDRLRLLSRDAGRRR